MRGGTGESGGRRLRGDRGGGFFRSIRVVSSDKTFPTFSDDVSLAASAKVWEEDGSEMRV